MAAYGLGEDAALVHGQRQRLLGVDVLSRLAGMDAGHDALKVTGGDDHRVDVGAVEQPAVVLHDVERRVPLLQMVGRVALGAGQVAVGERDEVGIIRKLIEKQPAAAAGADRADANAIGAARGVCAASRGGDHHCAGRGEERPPGDLRRRDPRLATRKAPPIRP